jgi:hypothetical protein
MTSPLLPVNGVFTNFDAPNRTGRVNLPKMRLFGRYGSISGLSVMRTFRPDADSVASLVVFQAYCGAWLACHFFPCYPFVLGFWEQGPSDKRAINVALLRENDYIKRSFAGNHNSIYAAGQKAQANPSILIGDRRMHQLVCSV